MWFTRDLIFQAHPPPEDVLQLLFFDYQHHPDTETVDEYKEQISCIQEALERTNPKELVQEGRHLREAHSVEITGHSSVRRHYCVGRIDESSFADSRARSRQKNDGEQ